MRLIIILSLIALAGGCSHWTQDRAVVCAVTCEGCKKITHTCNGKVEERNSEINN